MEPTVTETVVVTEELLSPNATSVSASLICELLVKVCPFVAVGLTVTWYDLEPVAPIASEPRSQVMVLPVTVHVGLPVQLPGT